MVDFNFIKEFGAVEFVSKGEWKTLDFAKKFARFLKPGDFVALFGGLGVGKTYFTKGLCEGLGFCGNVFSPTFALVNEYRLGCGDVVNGADNGEGLIIVHCDMYRIANELDLESVGFFDYLLKKNRIMVVEWCEHIINFLPASCYKVNLSYIDERSRLIKIVKS